MVFWFNLMTFVGVWVGSKDPRSLILELRLSEWLTVQVDSLGGGWKSETARVAIYGISRLLITLQRMYHWYIVPVLPKRQKHFVCSYFI